MSQLKPLRDIDRKWLALIGESPEEHQRQVLDQLNKVRISKGFSTIKGPDVHTLNRRVEQRLTATEDIADVVARMKAPVLLWIPDAYILFVRKWKCDCGSSGSCLDQPNLFLRHHKHQKKDPENSHLYVPVKGIENASLPRLREVRFAALHVCENCLETAKCQLPPSVQVDTASLTPGMQDSVASLGPISPSVEELNLLSITPDLLDGSTTTSESLSQTGPGPGSDSSEGQVSPPASANDILGHTEGQGVVQRSET